MPSTRIRVYSQLLGVLVIAAVSALNAAVPIYGQAGMEFTCGKTGGETSRTRLTAGSRYVVPGARVSASPAPIPAFGFDLVASPTNFSAGACSSDKPFFFSVGVPDGNYQVSLTLGSGAVSVTTVRAESRRLFVDRQRTPAGGSQDVFLNVSVRTELIAMPSGVSPGSVAPSGAAGDAEAGPARVKLKPREIGALDWDEKLTLEFNGDHPGFRSISVKPIGNVPTVYLAGDSTMVDQDKEPWAAWGQMLPVFFGPGVTIANEAESGETIRRFTGERRFDKILSTMRAGDYLMIQFAHNDQKQGTPVVTDLKGYLLRYVEATRNKGASPILVTSINRRVFDANGKIVDTLGGYPQAMREFAKEQNVPLIDLNAMSKIMFESMGPVGTLKAFVHFPANTFPEQTTELKDDTHFTAYGAYELARAVVQDILAQKLPLAQYLRKNISGFDLARPDDAATFTLPRSPLVSSERPYGR